MSSLLYEKQPKNLEKALDLAKQLNFDETKFIADIESKATAQIIADELEKGQALEIDATPTMIINGNKVVGVKPYYELKTILEENGATRGK